MAYYMVERAYILVYKANDIEKSTVRMNVPYLDAHKMQEALLLD